MNRRDFVKFGAALTAMLTRRKAAAAEARPHVSSPARAVAPRVSKQPASGQATQSGGFEPEYIVVGSGAGGGTVAARLAEEGFRVLVLEAGGDPRMLSGGDPQNPGANVMPENYDVPAFHALAAESDAMKWDFWVRHYADAARQRRDPKYRDSWNGKPVDGVLYPRAGTLGGCTAHNAMILVCPHDSDWTALADITGDPSWRPERMRAYFKRIERCRHRGFDRFLSRLGLNPSEHGWSGWLPTEVAEAGTAVKDVELGRTIIQSAIDALREVGFPNAARIAAKGDPNDVRVVKDSEGGLRYTPLTTRDHQRVGARERLLDVRDRYPDRLKIELHALATRVLFAGTRAIGVEYQKGERLYRAHANPNTAAGELVQAHASREVILAGGAFNSPQLLMLSGVGPRATLEANGIQPIVDLSGVGRNLQDRYEVAVVNRMTFPSWDVLEGATFTKADRQYQEWSDGRRGVYTSNGAVLSVILRSSPGQPDPDLFCYAVVGNFFGYFPGYSALLAKHPNCLTWVILKGHTNNTAGEVTLQSADPRDPPRINFRYFDEGNDPRGDDVRAVVDGIKFARKLTARMKRDGHVREEELPGDRFASDAELTSFVKDNAWGHHASCTCAIGDRARGGVLSGDFKVHGTEGLRVVDASVFPRVPGLFIVSAVYMVGEKAADVIAAAAKAARR